MNDVVVVVAVDVRRLENVLAVVFGTLKLKLVPCAEVVVLGTPKAGVPRVLVVGIPKVKPVPGVALVVGFVKVDVPVPNGVLVDDVPKSGVPKVGAAEVGVPNVVDPKVSPVPLLAGV